MKNCKCNLTIAIRCCSILLATFLGASAQAQTPAAGVSANQAEATARALMRRFRLSFVPVGFHLMPATSIPTSTRSRSNTLNLTPMAAGLNLQVLGGGTLGRLPKWTGFSSTNSVIGDSTIFEDKFGKVGIGTDGPTSRFTVAGMIETTLGGLKFPDGTVQTTAASGALQFVSHDSTLRGDGTSGSPLQVAVPLNLTGDASDQILLNVRNVGDSGVGVTSRGGDSSVADGGGGLKGFGGASSTGSGGFGLNALGGDANLHGGIGVAGTGGIGAIGGIGVQATGGNGRCGGCGGGDGIQTIGGAGIGTGNRGGFGILAQGGLGQNGASTGFAGFFQGNVQVTGSLSKGGGSFKIDHPLDPENKYLYHSFVESPDMKNIYDGVAMLDTSGEATVQLPDWFGALNKDFRYLLTPIGSPSPTLYIAQEITGNQFKIAGGTSGGKVSWQVTGIRGDAYANKHRIPVEEIKPEAERGTYLHPEAFDQPEDKNVFYVQHPEIRQRIKQITAKHQNPPGN